MKKTGVRLSASGFRSRIAWAAVALGLAASCKARPEGERPLCPTWKKDVGALLHDRCASCHSAATAAGGFDATTYKSVLSSRSGGQFVVVAGNEGSPLVEALDGDSHASVRDAQETLRTWVGECMLVYEKSAVHPAGILNPEDPEFHGLQLRRGGWDFKVCAKCHADDLKGRDIAVSCFSCHEKGPQDCSTCHGAEGRYGKSGAHAAHVSGGDIGRTFDCGECHVKPQRWDDAGHLLDADGKPLPDAMAMGSDGMPRRGRAPIHFGSLAGFTREGSPRAGLPSFEPESRTCSNVYCHGSGLDDKGSTPEPRWDNAIASCDACHGMPPAGHGAMLDCNVCHGMTVDASKHIIAPQNHVDGTVQSKGTACNTCHGSAFSAAPPPDLSGCTSTDEITVGAHSSHLFGPHRLRGPVLCAECHMPVEKPLDPGHFDVGPAKVFPPGMTGAGVVARADGAVPTWDRTAGKCSNVYCHGGGAKMSGDTEATWRQPPWTAVEEGATACGTCHGVPPLHTDRPGDPHTATMRMTECAGCHSKTIAPTGDIIFKEAPGAETTTHMNGTFDVDP